MTKKPHGTGRVGFYLVGDRWFAEIRGNLAYMRPVEVARAHGVRECVHCSTPCNSYCRACRRAVCADQCWDAHAKDHADWRERRAEWTKVSR